MRRFVHPRLIAVVGAGILVAAPLFTPPPQLHRTLLADPPPPYCRELVDPGCGENGCREVAPGYLIDNDGVRCYREPID